MTRQSRPLTPGENQSRPLTPGENQSRPLVPVEGQSRALTPADHPEEMALTGTQRLDPLRQALGNPSSLLTRAMVLQGRYEIEQVLGVGGMSTVYRGRDLRFVNVIRYCAIKEMPDTAPDPKTGALRSGELRAGSLAAGHLSNPGIVRIYDYFAENNRSIWSSNISRARTWKRCWKRRAAPCPRRRCSTGRSRSVRC